MTTENNKALTETTDEKPKESFKLVIWLSFGFIVTFVFGYLSFLVYVSWPISEWSVSKAASLGDSFGILSSLFSGLAFAGLIVTIVMQNKTLKLQMEELKEARKESARQSKAQEGQEKVMSAQFKAIQIQQFETTFFKIIDKHRLNVDSYKLEINGGVVSGFEYIKSCYSKVSSLEHLSSEEDLSHREFYKNYYCGFSRVVNLLQDNCDFLFSENRYKFYFDVFKDYLSIQDLNCLFFLSYQYSNDKESFYNSFLLKSYLFEGFDVSYIKLYNFSRDYDLILKDLEELSSFITELDGVKFEGLQSLYLDFYNLCLGLKKNYQNKVKIYKLELEGFKSEFLLVSSKEFSDKIEELYMTNVGFQNLECLFDADKLDQVKKYLSLKNNISNTEKNIESYSNKLNVVDDQLMRLKKLGIWQAPLTPAAS